jgi:hypothetical protein
VGGALDGRESGTTLTELQLRLRRFSKYNDMVKEGEYQKQCERGAFSLHDRDSPGGENDIVAIVVGTRVVRVVKRSFAGRPEVKRM